MADFDSYYMDTASFATASAVWVDATLTTKAADGYYQFDGVYRQQVSGLLLDSVACPACVTPCGGTISVGGTQGVYNMEISLGSTVGAVIVRFNPANFSIMGRISRCRSARVRSRTILTVFCFLLFCVIIKQ